MRRREQPTIPRVMYGTLVLTLDPDGTVRCETDQTVIGPADEYLELQPRLDAHVADMHPDLTPSTDPEPDPRIRKIRDRCRTIAADDDAADAERDLADEILALIGSA